MSTSPKGTSFFCEHTAEYVIVSRIRTVLEKNFDCVVPVYFWKSREGNAFSERIHQNFNVRVLAVFPRRPKLKSLDNKNIIIKINKELYEYSQAAKLVGIPTIAGAPLVNSISRLSGDNTVMWINLVDEVLEDVQFEVKCETEEILSIWPQELKLEAMNEEDILVLAEDQATQLVWKSAVENIRSLSSQRHRHDYFRGPFFFGGYKPIYFFIFDQ